jgi:hypothetical protein
MGHFGRPLAVVLFCGAGLVGCGGGGDDSFDIETTSDGRVLSGSDPVEAADFVSRTFPLLFASAEDVAPQATATTGTGSVTVVDANTIVVTLPGKAATTYNRISATEFEDDTGEVLTLEDVGAARYLFKSGGDPATDLLGAYGFETPVALRPVTATYSGDSASEVYFVPDGSAIGLWLFEAGTVDLVANFSGSGGTIRGTLFDGDFVGADFQNDGTADDTLFLRTTLNGVIDSEGFGGTVDGFAAISIAGNPPVNLNLSLSDTSVDGKFFGNEANVVAGTYMGDAAFTPPVGAAETGTLSGFFIAE